MSSEKIQVYLRIRPSLKSKGENEQIFEKKNILQDQQNNENSKQFVIDKQDNMKEYQFTDIFQQENNQELYQKIIEKQLNQKFFKGYNMTIFAYGQTNSGKTHTIFGHKNHEKGIIFQTLEKIFAKKQQKNNLMILVSYIEIYNEKINDLLQKDQQKQQEGPKVIENQGNFYIKNCREILVQNEEQALQILEQGNNQKTFGYSTLNNKSSRSHTIFKIILGKQNKKTREKCISELNFVDLAGSECLTDQFGYQQQEETKKINLSLFNLKQVIQSLSQNDGFIPYRQSLLTKLLSNSLGGNSSTQIICTVSPEEQEYQWSKRTLHFGQLAKKIENKIQQNFLQFQKQSGDNIKIVYKKKTQQQNIKISEKNLPKKNSIKKINKQTNNTIEELYIQDPNIQSIKNKVCLNCMGDPENPIALFLHCLGGKNYAGKQCMPYLFQPLVDQGFYVVAPDFPGYGGSEGEKFSSRITENRDKLINFIDDILFYLQQNYSQNCIILGYDYGASAALHFGSTQKALKRRASQLFIFHPSWNKSSPLEVLQKIQVKTTLLWVPADQFHSIQIGEQMNKIIPKSQLIKLDCGKFNSEKSKGNYECLAQQIEETVVQNLNINQIFQQQIKENDTLKNLDQLPNQQLQQQQLKQESDISSDDGTLSECISLLEVLQNRQNPESENFQKFGSACVRKQKKLDIIQENKQNLQEKYKSFQPKENSNLQQWAIQQFKYLILTQQIDDYYTAYLTNTQMKPQVVKLFGNLPILAPDSSIDIFKDIYPQPLYEKIKKNYEILQKIPEFPKNKQVFVKTQVQANMFQDNYLCHSSQQKQSQYLTHKAQIENYNEQNEIFTVKIKKNSQDQSEYSLLDVPKKHILSYNKQTNFKQIQQHEYLFEDGVKCKYSDFFTRAKMLESALSITSLLQELDLENLEEKYENNVKILKKCTENILSNIDLIHLVKEGIDPNRYCSTDCGKLAYYGQGTCHILASVVCAFLLPFSKLLGIDIKFRAGFLPKKLRDVDENDNQIKEKWNGSPRLLEDHTWSEISYKINQQSYIIDSSFGYYNVPVEFVYSEYKNGRQHISEKPQCNSNPPIDPQLMHEYQDKQLEKIIMDKKINENYGEKYLVQEGMNMVKNPISQLETVQWENVLSSQQQYQQQLLQ